MKLLLTLCSFALGLGLSSSTDPCLDVIYADEHYGDCCGSGNYKQPGHQAVCHELQKERRAEGDAKNIDFHKEPPESKVIVIEGDIFYERVAKRHDVMLLMFYAPWCGYCKNFSPEFRKAANDLHHYGITFAKIDTTHPDNAGLKTRYGIKSYPTLKILFSGEVDERLSSGIQFIRGADDVGNFMKHVKDRKEPPMPEGYELTADGLKGPDTAAKAAPKKKLSPGGTAEPDDSMVIILDDDTFHDHITKHSATMVEFFAPWCGHCKKLAPKYTEAASVLAKHDGIRLAKVDATAHKARADELGVRGYPSVKVFLNGEFYEDYKQAREAEAIVSYMRKLATKASPASPVPVERKREKRENPSRERSTTVTSDVPAPSDPCLDEDYAEEFYGKCCGAGGVRQPGHQEPCRAARARTREL